MDQQRDGQYVLVHGLTGGDLAGHTRHMESLGGMSTAEVLTGIIVHKAGSPGLFCASVRLALRIGTVLVRALQ